MKITNVEVNVNAALRNANWYHCSVCWEADGYRYHYWANPDLTGRGAVLHRNAIGRDEHRELSITAKANQAMATEAVMIAQRDGLYAKSLAEFEAHEAKKVEDDRARRVETIKADFGPALFATLKDLLNDPGERNPFEARQLIARIEAQLAEVK